MFVFNAYGNTYTVIRSELDAKAADSITDGLSDLCCAYQVANEKLIWSNRNSRNGIWMKVTGPENTYEWIEDSNIPSLR